MPSIDWETYEAEGGEAETPPPASTYMAVVETAEGVKTKKAPPRDMLKLRLRISAGPEKGKALFTQILVDPDSQPFAKQRTMRQLAALGLTAKLLNQLTDEESAERAVGVEVSCDTEIDAEYDPSNP